MAAGVMWAGCGGSAGVKIDASGLPTNRPVTQSDILRFPESHLYYPGSGVMRLVGASQSPTHPGEEPNTAYSGALLTAHTSPGSLFAWYQKTLATQGYTPATYYRLSSQTAGRAWQRHRRLQVQVAIYDPANLKADIGISVAPQTGTVVYEEVLVGYPPGLPKD
jgi:hypothetical protein